MRYLPILIWLALLPLIAGSIAFFCAEMHAHHNNGNPLFLYSVTVAGLAASCCAFFAWWASGHMVAS